MAARGDGEASGQAQQPNDDHRVSRLIDQLVGGFEQIAVRTQHSAAVCVAKTVV
jgi:hypothetical protein